MSSLPKFAPAKDPASRLDYQLDLTNLLEASEQIINATVTTSPSGLVNEGTSILSGGKIVQVIFSGGTPCVTYTVTLRAETDSGGPPTRIFELSCLLDVEDR